MTEDFLIRAFLEAYDDLTRLIAAQPHRLESGQTARYSHRRRALLARGWTERRLTALVGVTQRLPDKSTVDAFLAKELAKAEEAQAERVRGTRWAKTHRHVAEKRRTGG